MLERGRETGQEEELGAWWRHELERLEEKKAQE
ncbi:hypothetical protein CfE428DRAFT_0268 [Chthoniobacter flavus Ellin428]|uniref:Uncharacterized protein n=1 Tax=Chthoniobacter flavus Ellin428 TaxID=497964 RepID=B4CUA5_9BACT|nr:hypothetical protein CfE428DRAFT_0268 [Chthoniobacter flavus Ellin428]TCO94824.1 hypothetical protein EV701_102293 [Chthoniobacter flavus]